MGQPAEQFDSWAIIEIFGHQKFAGRVTEQSIGGASFIRCDIHEVDGSPSFTKLFGASAIYSITPVTEELARKAVKACRSEPISVYIPQERQIPAGADPAKPGEVDPENAHDCVACGSPCDCGVPGDCEECSACDNEDDPGF